MAVFEAQHFGKIIHRREDANHDPFQELAPVSLLKFSYENYDQIIEEDKFLVSVKRLTEVSILLRPLLPMPSCRRPSFTTHQMIHMKQNTISQDRCGIRIVNTCVKPNNEETAQQGFHRLRYQRSLYGSLPKGNAKVIARLYSSQQVTLGTGVGTPKSKIPSRPHPASQGALERS